MQYSILGILVLTTAVAFQFQSRFMVNIGISITFFTLLISFPSVYSIWPRRMSLNKSDQNILHRCVTLTMCGTFNAILIILAFLLTDLATQFV